MTDYTKTTDFTSKDSLPSGDSGKIIRGAEFGTEFDNIETAVNSKSNIDNPTFTGNITVTGTVDGRDIAADGTKLDTVETNADVTDTANVTAAGALMDSEVTNLAQVKAFDSADYATAAQGTTADNALPKTGGAMTGAITTNSTFDGRDVATDGTKLDGIEASADVTDTANVTAAGALMDSELTSIASVKALNQGVATTDSPTFAGVTANGTVEFDGLSGTGAVTVTDILDQDDMSGNSATALATQQSIKAYVDSQVGTVDTLAEVLANGNATGGTDIAFGDNDKAVFGTGSDLQIYHDSNNSFVKDAGTGDLYIAADNLRLTNAAATEFYARAISNGAFSVYYDGVEKLATTSTGIDVTGTATLDGLSVQSTSASATVATFKGSSSFGFTLSASAVAPYIQTVGVGSGEELAITSGGNKVALFQDGGNVQFFEDTGTTAKFHWDAADERLGLGTSNPISMLQLLGSPVATSGALATFRNSDATASNTTFGGILFNSSPGTDFSIGKSNVNSATTLSFRNGNTGASYMDIASDGKVGIGTDDPALFSKLHVSSTTTALDAGGTIFASVTDAVAADIGGQVMMGGYYTGTTTAAFGGLAAKKENATTGNFGGYLQFLTSTNGSGNTEKMRITSDGLVGIGTDNPSTKLHVNAGTGNIAATFESTDAGSYINLIDSASGTYGAMIGASGDDIVFSPNNVEAMRIDSDGKVGIGTSNPAFAASRTGINIKGTTANGVEALLLDNTDTGHAGFALVKDGVDAFIYNRTNGIIGFGTNNTERLRITSGGLVGIGTDDPSETLTVSGNIQIEDNDGYLQFKDTNGGTNNKFRRIYNSAQDLFISRRNDDGSLEANDLVIDSSGNVGIGTSTPNFYGKTAIKGGKAGNADSNLSLLTSGDAQGEDANLAFYGTFVGTADNGPRRTADITSGFEGGNWGTEYLSFSVGKSGSSNDTRALTNEAMRIDGSQNLLVGRTSASGVDTDGHVLFANGVSYQSMTDNAAQFVNRNGTGDGPITSFYKNGSTVGSIGTEGGALYISSPYGNDSGLRFVSGIVGPATTTGANRDGAIDLGYDNGRFKDLYLSGGAYLGGTGSANKLDDYEEGTWTGTLIGDTAAPSSSVTATGTYTKIGRQVIVQISFDAKNTTGASGVMRVNGLPFVAGARGFGPTMKSNMGTQNLTSFVSSGQNSVTFSEMSNMTTFTISAASSIYLRFALMYESQ